MWPPHHHYHPSGRAPRGAPSPLLTTHYLRTNRRATYVTWLSPLQARHAELHRHAHFDPSEELAYVPMGQARYLVITPMPSEELAYVPMGQARYLVITPMPSEELAYVPMGQAR